jgi:sec-independent protein translocase protein TatC
MSEQSEPLSSHLNELRNRLVYCIIAILCGVVVSLLAVEPVLKALTSISDISFIFVDITEMVLVYIQVCMVISIVLATPVILYNTARFIAPALSVSERLYLWLMPFVMFLFVGGVLFGYYIVAPPAIQFLVNFGSGIAEPQIRIGNYISTMIGLLISIGVVFEIPVVAIILAGVGAISAKWMRNQWKVAFIVSFIIGAVITPTFDPINQSIVSVPIFMLYSLSIILVMIIEKLKTKGG